MYMLIAGTQIAQAIKTNLQKQVQTLAKRSITPLLAIIHLSDDAGSSSYIRQKMKIAEEIGAKTKIFGKETGIHSPKDLEKTIKELNDDPGIHGIIIQRPVPEEFDDPKLLLSIVKGKDVDGFAPDSPFETPVALAVEEILIHIYHTDKTRKVTDYSSWIKEKIITIIGKGETAGAPIQKYFKRQGLTPSIVDTKTERPEDVLKTSDIIISCVGKRGVIRKETVKEGVILISVGISRDEVGKLHGDYEEEEMKDIASYYTPTPGGVGPVNVACLFMNILQAATPKHPKRV